MKFEIIVERSFETGKLLRCITTEVLPNSLGLGYQQRKTLKSKVTKRIASFIIKCLNEKGIDFCCDQDIIDKIEPVIKDLADGLYETEFAANEMSACFFIYINEETKMITTEIDPPSMYA